LAINTIAMPLDQANGSTMVMFFFRVGHFFLVGPVLSWRERFMRNYSFAFCACGWGLALFRNFWAGKVCFYVFMFFENEPVDTLWSSTEYIFTSPIPIFSWAEWLPLPSDM
jgi:hypothetical protein